MTHMTDDGYVHAQWCDGLHAETICESHMRRRREALESDNPGLGAVREVRFQGLPQPDEVLEREDLDDLAADYPLPDYIEAEEAGW